MIEFLNGPGGNAMGVCFSGKVVQDDYRQLDVRLRHLIDLWGHVGLVVVLRNGATFSLSARCLGALMRLRRVGHVTRLAMVGPPEWERQLHRHLPLSRTHARYFQPDQLPEAWRWAGQRTKDDACMGQ